MWTQERIKRFWEACGFVEVLGKENWRYEEFKETNYWWQAPKGGRYLELPSITDLNALFKYAVPKVCEEGYSVELWALKGFESIIKKEDEIISDEFDFEDPALALAGAIEKAIIDENRTPEDS